MSPERIWGTNKLLTEARFAAHALKLLAKKRAEGAKPRPTGRSWREEVDAQRGYLRFFGGRKYARFQGKTFFEMYLPCAPSPVFDRMIQSKVWYYDDHEVGFIPTVDLAITDACMFRCEHCYAIDQLGKKNALELVEWKKIVDNFQKGGAGAFTIVGGEPLLRFDDLCELTEHAHHQSDVWLVTTGFSLTPSKAKQLRASGLTAAAISLDHWDPERHNKFRGSPKAFDEAAKAVALFSQAGVFPCLVVTATRDMIADGGLMRLLELAHRLGAGFVQIFDPVSAGAYLERHDVRLSLAELAGLEEFMRMVNTRPEYRHLPPVTVRSTTEDSEAFGCGAGGNNFIHVNPVGDLVACPMLAMSTGNIVRDGFDTSMRRMRDLFPHATGFGPRCPGNILGEQIHEAVTRTGKSVLPYEETERLAAVFKETPRPKL
jgi:MoaA/NifB/PqqE/SkfB family radical SAM enzyme